MPPLQPASTMDLATTIPFADHSPSPFDKLFGAEQLPTAQPTITTARQYTRPVQTSAPNTPLPSEADISALFGLSVPAAQQPAMSTPVPPVPQGRSTPLQQHRGRGPMTAAPAPHQSNTTAAHAAHQDSIMSTQHRYPSHNHTSTLHRTPSPPQSQSQPQQLRNQHPHQHHQQHHQQHYQQHRQEDRQQYRHQQQYNPNQFNINGYSVINADYSDPYDHGQTGSAVADSSYRTSQSGTDSMGFNASSGDFFSQSRTGDSAGLFTENQGSFAPKFAKAASYVSSTLAVTSSFASEKLSTASTKIADLWQHKQDVLPQQQQQHQ